MTWLWVILTVVSGSVGDVLSADGMARKEHIENFDVSGIRHILNYVLTHRFVMFGIAANAVSFISFMVLLTVADLSFAVPVSSLGYIVRTVLAKLFLGEEVTAKRWASAVLVVIGVILISV